MNQRPGTDASDRPELIVDYDDADELIRAYHGDISRGEPFITTERMFDDETEVTLVLSFPGLVKPLRIPATVRGTSQRDEGRGVTLNLPEFAAQKADLDKHLERIAASDPTYTVRTVRVLVVEDNPHCAKLIQDGLRLAGKRAFDNTVAFDVRMAANAADAFTVLHGKVRIDVLITDIYLGGVSGTTVIEHIRADSALRELPVIAISAGDETTEEIALQAGANVFLPKPVRLRQIVRTVGQVLDLEQVAWR